MTYTDNFKLTDDVIRHLDTVIGGISDPFLSSRYVGFVAVASVTVYELAIKEIFIDFGQRKHKILGEFTRRNFDRINGRIKTSIIKDEYVICFGDKYVQRFKQKLDEAEKNGLRRQGISILTCYGNVITWRNQFAHEGQVPSTVTYDEIKKSYEAGKEVIRCLAETMQR